jgi:hypothetical protein
MPGQSEFVVSERIPALKILRNIHKGTYREATKEWDALVGKWTDAGLRRNDPIIVGFHEEG